MTAFWKPETDVELRSWMAAFGLHMHCYGENWRLVLGKSSKRCGTPQCLRLTLNVHKEAS